MDLRPQPRLGTGATRERADLRPVEEFRASQVVDDGGHRKLGGQWRALGPARAGPDQLGAFDVGCDPPTHRLEVSGPQTEGDLLERGRIANGVPGPSMPSE